MGRQVILEVKLEMQKLTVNWATWVYNDCCCDICTEC